MKNILSLYPSQICHVLRLVAKKKLNITCNYERTSIASYIFICFMHNTFYSFILARFIHFFSRKWFGYSSPDINNSGNKLDMAVHDITKVNPLHSLI